jgi:cyclohexyl-isocyanide hydratase
MRLGFVLYPNVTALDAVGPFEVLARVPGVSVEWVAAGLDPVTAQHGLSLVPTQTWESCPPLDVVCVPGGGGQVAAMEDAALLAFLRQQSEAARWVTSVCTGSLLLGAAGLLRGYRATTHWRYLDCLSLLGAVPVRKRVVADRNRITAAGVSAGLDMGLFLAAALAGDQCAQQIQLSLEYDPQPPFHSGSPDRADPDLVERVEEDTAALHSGRKEQIRRLVVGNPATERP